jgi:glycosyltransferase involved in cell wall biosynthesis
LKVGIFHGYELTGSGSNEYTRYLARALAVAGHEVHIICRETVPQSFEFINECIQWDKSGNSKILFERKVLQKGKCILHQLPMPPINAVYLTDKQRKGNVKAFINLTNDELRVYHEFVVKTLQSVLENYPLDILHANHLIYQPVAAAKVCKTNSIPFIIYPHGSDIEYTIRKDIRFKELALQAILQASGLIIGNHEVRDRILNIYPDFRKSIQEKTEIVGVGVDTSLFEPVSKSKRRQSVQEIINKGPFGGKDPELTKKLHMQLDQNDMIATTQYYKAYNNNLPDQDLSEHLKLIPWEQKILLFVGALTVGKGIQSLIVALTFILKKQPDAHLLIVGSGAYREVLEGLIYAISTKNESLLDNLVAHGNDLDQNELTGKWPDVAHFLSDSKNKMNLLSIGVDLQEHVHFLGRLGHDLLCHLFPCADVAIFPSVVPEAYPLVLMESLSNGVLPVVSYFSGFADGVDELIPYLGIEWVEHMKIPIDYQNRIPGLIKNLPLVMSDPDLSTISPKLRKIAVENYDWNIRAQQMIAAYSRFI